MDSAAADQNASIKKYTTFLSKSEQSTLKISEMIFLFFLLIFHHIHAVTLLDDEFKPSSILLHKTAAFGPQPGSYKIAGELLLASPLHLCSQTTPVQNLTRRLVLVERGNCTFIQKVRTAQSEGAIGIIVGNSADMEDSLVLMTAASDPTIEIRIPSVFISRDSFNILSSRIRLKETFVIISEAGEVDYSASPLSDQFIRVFSIVIISIPAIWCVGSVLFILGKVLSHHQNRYRRQLLLSSIPSVPFTANAVRTDSFFTHNDMCPICLVEFEENEMVLQLPCSHGFHSFCIFPWIQQSSEECPVCKGSVFRETNVRPRRSWMSFWSSSYAPIEEDVEMEAV